VYEESGSGTWFFAGYWGVVWVFDKGQLREWLMRVATSQGLSAGRFSVFE